MYLQFTLPRTAFDAFRDLLYTYCDDDGRNSSKGQLIGVCVDNNGNKIEPGRGIFEGLCYKMTVEDIMQYPIVSVQFDNNVVLNLKPINYMRDGGVFCSNGEYTIGIDSGAVSGGTLLGDTFMSSFLTVFDRENKQIGFIDSEIACGMD